ncbi:MAG: hypothetical protein K2H45_13865 [Acetatifactor sp.]|nr:hypothetical protein [Acetatifactor sp.]
MPSTSVQEQETAASTPSPAVPTNATEEVSDESDAETEIPEESAAVENPTQIVDDMDEWEIVDIPVSSVPKEARYIGATENGFYYWMDEAGKWRYYFYSWNGEINCVFDEGIKGEHYYSADMMTDCSLLLTIQYTEGVTTYQVYEDGTVEEILTQTMRPVPERYCVNEYIYFTQYDTLEDGSETGKVLRFDRNTKELEVLYQTEYKDGNGKEVYLIGGTDQEVFLAVREYRDYYQTDQLDYYVVKIDPDTKTILSQAEEQYGALYITGSGDRVLIAENSATESLSESGKVYMWADSLVSPVAIPGMSASEAVNWSMLSGNHIIMKSGYKGYIWDLETDTIHKLDLRKLNAINSTGMSTQGFSGLVLQEDGLYWREMRLK